MSHDEVLRVVSPDAHIDAVLVESSGGATTPFAYDVYVLAHGAVVSGEPALRLVAALRNDVGAAGANLRWLDADTLSVEYLRARDAPPADVSKIIAGRSIRILAHSGFADASAPPGGMWYNRNRTRAAR